jgi:hypothetical protein
VLISGRFEGARKSNMPPSMPPFLSFTVVALRLRVPEFVLEIEGRSGRMSIGSEVYGLSVIGTDRRRVAIGLLLVKISFRVAVFALLGRVGGVGDICCFIGAAAKGSGAERLCFLPLDCGL